MKTIISILLALLVLSDTFAQSRTGGNVPPQCLFDQVLRRAGITHEQLLSAYQADGATAKTVGSAAVYDIPVVFHLVYAANQPGYNLPDSRILNQLAILNNAFRKRHRDTGRTRAFFKPVSADAQIQFHLATRDPLGNPTTGITRTVSPRAYFGSYDLDSIDKVKHTSAGGIDPWPTSRYFNIWICNMADSTGQVLVIGYGTPPLNPLPPNWPSGTDTMLAPLRDGVVMDLRAIGDNNPYRQEVTPVATKGKTLVHECGHYLGLAHQFGSGAGSSTCGTREASDGIGDTPEQSEISFTDSTAPPSASKNTCGSGPRDSVDMWEDYMDYVNDTFMTLFSAGQVQLMRSVLGHQRAGLTSTVDVDAYAAPVSINVYPNPANAHIRVAAPWQARRIVVMSRMGEKMMELEGADASAMEYDLSCLAPGQYFLQLESAEGAVARRAFLILR